MDVFGLRDRLTQDYGTYVGSFIQIRDQRIRETVDMALAEGAFWPEPLIQLNPSFKIAATISDLVNVGTLHPECEHIFQREKDSGFGETLRLYQHQVDAVETARERRNYILTTGTGSGKSLAYIIPIVDHVLRHGTGRGIQAIIVYPMNALANSQYGELEKFLVHGYPAGQSPVTFEKYTGQESDEKRKAIITNPPDILLTNYVMLELIMTRPHERQLLDQAMGLRFLVLDELHTYRGRQGADVALLVRRVRNRLEAEDLLCIGTSATLASEGSFEEQQQEVAVLGTRIFGSSFEPAHVIGETLQRSTQGYDPEDDNFWESLTERLDVDTLAVPTDYRSYVSHPLSRWIESVFGIRLQDGRLVRQEPRSIGGERGAARELSERTGLPEAHCAKAIQVWLLAGYRCDPNPETGFKPFAFRLHQLLSPGDTVYASIEAEDTRYITIQGQQYVPGSNREKTLFPVCFCRECGQEYYAVRITTKDDERRTVTPREFSDHLDDSETEAGYLYISTEKPWPLDAEAVIGRLPDDWLEMHRGALRVRRHRRGKLPQGLYLQPNGESIAQQTGNSIVCVYISTPFMFCLNCGVSYTARQNDFGKLASLSSEGRSSATTLLSLSAILALKATEDLPEHARKLLSFTDNRQDASLQAGHFNDFVEVALLRGAIYRAVADAGADGLTHDVIAHKVFDALNLPLELYATDSSIRFQALHETQKALRQVLGYRIYRDLRRGWRIMSPNLEQSGLLEIDYLSLEELCQTEEVWQDCHSALVTASPATRAKVGKVLLDYMRRELAIKVDYLEGSYQERIQQISSQRLIEPWAIDEHEQMVQAAVLFPRSSREHDYGGNVYVSARGGFGMYLRRRGTFPEYDDVAQGALGLDDTGLIIPQLLEGLKVAGLVEVVVEADDDVSGYQVVASSMVWRVGDGEQAFHDPIRVPSEATEGNRPNRFFVDFYQEVAEQLVGFRAREHTAQVPYEDREKREEAFRRGTLPILYCSPTMELGVDIAELNVVNMRNVPPTPANYAQRSGRAGRSGQPALVFTYCSNGSPHDQYFFRRPELMVAGAVATPRLDLSNEDLLRAHIHAIWLAETQMDLGKTLKDILDLDGTTPSLELLPENQGLATSTQAKSNAMRRAYQVLSTVRELENPQDLVDRTLQTVFHDFDQACERWRGLYRSALKQAEQQGKIIRDATREASDKRQAERLRREAEAQLRLLTEADRVAQSDFYSYRYFATEGFLPGYSFPRLPISAFIPARRVRQQDEFLSRPRFLAISEFGPRSIIYHEGSRYIINQVIMPVDTAAEGEILTTQVKQCEACGYVHPVNETVNFDVCERCKNKLGMPLHSLLRMQNVVTKRRDRISSDEEDRLRMGYDLRTGVRFTALDRHRQATVYVDDQPFAQLTYAPAATIWRINLGWRRRKNQQQYGFVLDVERGYWARNEQMEDDPSDPMSARTKRVIPYVEDSRNCLLFEPIIDVEPEEMASLQAALKRAIEACYQMESNELAVEPLPNVDTRRLLLFYEAAEGGAGVLRHLVDDPDALSVVACEALQICHFDPETGEDQHRHPRAREDCEAACYDCLLSYSNQRDHALLDRHSIRDTLGFLARATVMSSPTADPREEHLHKLLKLCQSQLEKDWLQYIYDNGLRLPDDAQVLVKACGTRPDFIYDSEGAYAAIYVDGSYHDYPHRQERDREQAACLEDDLGVTVVRFGYRDDWDAIIDRFSYIFGT